MQVQKKQLSETKIQLTIIADEAILETSKREVLENLNRTQVKLPGFRKGKAPTALIEKQIDPAVLQSDFLDNAVNKLYVDALTKEKIRPVARPDMVIKKFVPFTTLELEATVEAIGEVKIPDYKQIKLAKKAVKVTDKDVEEVLTSLSVRAAEKKEVERASRKDDEVQIDFAGTDAKTEDPVQGADGKDYTLLLGSNTFIPGFEDNLIGLKAGEEKTFDLTFPKDYGVSALQNRKVTFTVKVTKVSELVKPEITDSFAASVGPFKTVSDLRADIKKQLAVDHQQKADRDYESELVEKITDQSKVALPKTLIDEEIERIEAEERQSLVYRGQTWQEHLDSEGVTEEEHREQKRPAAENRVKAGLVLSEIAEKEKIDVTSEELKVRLQILKGQYQDPQMQAELDKPENRREIAARLVTEKTIEKLTKYATAK